MRELLSRIFEHHLYRCFNDISCEIPDIEFWMPESKETKLEAFFIVQYIRTLEDLSSNTISEKCLLFYEHLKKKNILQVSSEKNTYVIICVKLDEPDFTLSSNQIIQRKIYDIEEDPYMFKKHVILYTESQIEELYSHSLEKRNTVIETLYGILNDGKAFSEFKENPIICNIYWLIASLFVKLPFLKYVGEAKEIEDLSKIIDDKISQIGQVEWKLVNKILEMNIDNILKLETGQILSMLKGGIE